MKNLFSILFFLVFGLVAIWEQSKPKPNKIVLVLCLGVLMYGIYQLMKKIPSKNQDKEDE